MVAHHVQVHLILLRHCEQQHVFTFHVLLIIRPDLEIIEMKCILHYLHYTVYTHHYIQIHKMNSLTIKEFISK